VSDLLEVTGVRFFGTQCKSNCAALTDTLVEACRLIYAFLCLFIIYSFTGRVFLILIYSFTSIFCLFLLLLFILFYYFMFYFLIFFYIHSSLLLANKSPCNWHRWKSSWNQWSTRWSSLYRSRMLTRYFRWLTVCTNFITRHCYRHSGLLYGTGIAVFNIENVHSRKVKF